MLAAKVGKSLLDKRAADEQGEAQRSADIAAGKLDAARTEDKRQGALQGYQGVAQQMADKGFMTIDPAMMAKLGARRDYSDLIEKGAVDRTAGSGSAFLAGLMGAGADTAAQYDVNQDPLGETGISVGQPVDPALLEEGPN
jgi:hypothetical protein